MAVFSVLSQASARCVFSHARNAAKALSFFSRCGSFALIVSVSVKVNAVQAVRCVC